MQNEHLVSTEWLAAHLNAPQLRIVDLRGHLRWEFRDQGEPWRTGRSEYEESHIPGAVHLDFATDLVDLDDPVPLQVAPLDKLARILGNSGIGDSHMVVAYDADRSIFATRLWWIFKLCGRSNLRILDGGWPKWSREECPVSSEMPEYLATTFTVDARSQRRSVIGDVINAIDDASTILVDARVPRDYLGEPKWADRGGHIPGAVNVPGSDFLRDDGTFYSLEELRAIVEQANIPQSGNIIAYCGLGLSATAFAFVLDMLGNQYVSVFDGSWAEWGAREDLAAE